MWVSGPVLAQIELQEIKLIIRTGIFIFDVVVRKTSGRFLNDVSNITFLQ